MAKKDKCERVPVTEEHHQACCAITCKAKHSATVTYGPSSDFKLQLCAKAKGAAAYALNSGESRNILDPDDPMLHPMRYPAG